MLIQQIRGVREGLDWYFLDQMNKMGFKKGQGGTSRSL